VPDRPELSGEPSQPARPRAVPRNLQPSAAADQRRYIGLGKQAVVYERSRAAPILLLALIGCVSRPISSEPTTWHPIPGVSVLTWHQVRAICSPILQQGAIADRRGVRAAENAKAQHRACMGQNGWTDQAPKISR
jgi:hypothetical protein